LVSMSLVIWSSCAPLACMNRNEYHTPWRRAARRVLSLRAVMASRSGRRSPFWRAKAGSGGPAMPMAVPPGLRTRSDLARVSPPWESRTMS